MEERIKTLAAQMGVTESDVRGFVNCLRLWIAKGYSLEHAIERHMAQMTRLVNHAACVAADPEIRATASAEVWSAVNA